MRGSVDRAGVVLDYIDEATSAAYHSSSKTGINRASSIDNQIETPLSVLDTTSAIKRSRYF
jgi:hypothetical protein